MKAKINAALSWVDEKAESIMKAVILILLVAVFVVLLIFTLEASNQILRNTQQLVIKTCFSGSEATAAINLQIDAYKAVVNDVIAPLLGAFVLTFLGYVTGVTITTVSYNRGIEKGANAEALKRL